MATDPFDILPEEVLICIFEHFDGETLIAGSATCRRWKEIIKHAKFAYAILCYRFGYEDGPPDPSMPSSARLAALEAHVSRFDRIPSTFEFRMPIPERSMIAFSDGLLGVVRGKTSQITFYDMSSWTVQRREWAVDGGVPFRCFYINRHRHLLVLWEADDPRTQQHFHVRSIDTGETHPETSLPILPIPVPYGETIRTTIKLSDLYIAILSKYNGMEGRNLTISQSVTELMIWNWKSGDLVLRISPSVSDCITTLSFISPTHLLVGNRRNAKSPTTLRNLEAEWLALYSLEERKEPTRFTLPNHPDGHPTLGKIISNPPSVPEFPRPFYPSPYDGVIYIEVHEPRRDYTNSHPNTFAIVAYSSTLISLSRKRSISSDQSLPWATWGQKCHMVPEIMLRGMAIQGLRLIPDLPHGIPKSRSKIRIWDFSRRGTHVDSRDSLRKTLRDTIRFTSKEIYCGMPLRQVIGTTFAWSDSGALYMDEDQIYMIAAGRGGGVKVLTYQSDGGCT